MRLTPGRDYGRGPVFWVEMRTLMLAAAAAAVLAAGLVPGEALARVELRGVTLRAGPTIAGAEAFAFAEEPARGKLAIQLADGTGHTRRLSQFDPLLRQGPPADRFVALEASARRVAVGFTLQGFADGGAGFDRAVNRLGEVQAAALDGPAERLVRCEDQARLAGSLAVDGDAVAFDDPDCATGRIGIRDYAAATPATTNIGTAAAAIRLAGGFAAVDRGDDVAVFDRTTGGLVYTASGSPDRVAGSPLGFDVQSDGTLVVAALRDGRCTLERYSVAEPVARALPYSARCASLIRLSAGRILFDRLIEGGTQLSIGDLAGTEPQPVAARAPAGREGRVVRTAPTGERDPGFDLDGERFAYADPDCTGGKIVSDSLAAALAREPSPLEQCPAQLKIGRQVRVTAGGAFRIGIACGNGCQGVVFVDERGTGRDIGFRGSEPEPRVRPGARSTRVTVRLTRGELSRLKRTGRTCLVLRFRVPWPDGKTRDTRARPCLLAPRR